jgi:hypothetical protein
LVKISKILFSIFIFSILLNTSCFNKNGDTWTQHISKSSSRQYLLINSENIDSISKSKNWKELETENYENVITRFFHPKIKTQLYIKSEFEFENAEKITECLLQVPYNLYFTAYLNNIEIAKREKDDIHINLSLKEIKEKKVGIFGFEGKQNFFIDKNKFSKTLKNGTNSLIIKVLNENKVWIKFYHIQFFSKSSNNQYISFASQPELRPEEYFTTSTLPIIKIETNNQKIVDEPKIEAKMGIIFNEKSDNNISDKFNNYNGKIAIEIRGGTSQTFAQKSYSFKTIDENGKKNNVSLLNFPEDNEWILYGPYVDKTLIRNNLVFKLGQEMNLPASKTQFCELIINGDYRGIYVLMQKIKIGNEILNFSEDSLIQISTPNFIVKIDKGSDYGWTSLYSKDTTINKIILFKFVDPKFIEITKLQRKYIKESVTKFEDALYLNNYQEVEKLIDVNSFVDFFIINEFTKNIDAYRLSTYLHKELNGKIKMGPIWDYNYSLGLPDYNDGFKTDGWIFKSSKYIPFWWENLVKNEKFKNKLIERWNFLRKKIFTINHINLLIDNEINQIKIPYKRHNLKWKINENSIQPNFYNASSLDKNVDYMKNWINERIIWIDKNINKL